MAKTSERIQHLALVAADRLVDWLRPLLDGDDPSLLTGRRAADWRQARTLWQRLAADGAAAQRLVAAGRDALDDWDAPGRRDEALRTRRRAVHELGEPLRRMLEDDEELRHWLGDELGHPLPLVIYRLDDGVEAFEQALKDPEREDLVSHDPVPGAELDFDARLFVVPPFPLPPAWLPFLQEGFDDVEVAASAANQALLVVRVEEGGAGRWFALPFGMGHLLLDRERCERRFGLKTALNAIFAKGAAAAQEASAFRLRSLDWTTVARTTFRTRRQAGRPARFDEFGMDVRRDMLGGVTGRPADEETWGTRITGGDPVRLARRERFADLATLCRELLALRRGGVYSRRFPWIDAVQPLPDGPLARTVETLILEDLRTGRPPRAELAPPELVDFAATAAFAVEVGGESRQMDDPYLEHLFALLPEGRRRELDLATLRQGARVHALGDDGEPVGSWSLWEWLEAEVEHEGSTYLLSGGALWLVRPEYRDDLDAFLSRLEAWPRYPLPDSLPGEVEGDYNTRAADESDGRLLSLDAKTVRMPSNPDPIEVCDLLSDHGELIHVKRKLRSSSLSHLFGQGAVSGELLFDPEFRSVAAERARKEQEEAGLGTDFAATLPGTDGDGRRRVVVYAVIADWNGRSLVEAVPFFSRVNLRNHVERLRALGYDVYFNPVPVLQAAVAKKGRQPQAPPEAVPKGA